MQPTLCNIQMATASFLYCIMVPILILVSPSKVSSWCSARV